MYLIPHKAAHPQLSLRFINPLLQVLTYLLTCLPTYLLTCYLITYSLACITELTYALVN